jgi:hypothetical protein
MKRLIGVYVLLGFTMGSLAQNIVGPHGEGSVVFRSPGGRWQEAVITDQLTGESSTAYSLEAEPSGTDARAGRHPRIVFSCQHSGKFDGIWIRSGTVVANQFPSPSDHLITLLVGPKCRVAVTAKKRKRGLLTLQKVVRIWLRMKASSLILLVTRNS